jgi:nitrogen fixation NifU-like protein
MNTMSENLDEFVEYLQDQIHEEIKEAYGQVAFQRWIRPLYAGALEDPDGHARVTGSCGDAMEIYLKFDQERVSEATFQTEGCGASHVCGSFAAEMALGKSPDELLDITGESVLDRIGGLPKEEQHCAFLAAETLQEALNDYMLKQNQKSDIEGFEK